MHCCTSIDTDKSFAILDMRMDYRAAHASAYQVLCLQLVVLLLAVDEGGRRVLDLRFGQLLSEMMLNYIHTYVHTTHGSNVAV